jgi:hypothetical protein
MFMKTLIALLLCVSVASEAQTDSATKGIRSMMVEMNIGFLDTTAVRTTLELALRRAGIHVVSPESGEKVDAVLTFDASTMHDPGDQFFPVEVHLLVDRAVYLHPTPGATRLIATVWRKSYFASNNWSALKEVLERGTDQLTNEWLAVNPHVGSR